MTPSYARNKVVVIPTGEGPRRVELKADRSVLLGWVQAGHPLGSQSTRCTWFWSPGHRTDWCSHQDLALHKLWDRHYVGLAKVAS